MPSDLSAEQIALLLKEVYQGNKELPLKHRLKPYTLKEIEHEMQKLLELYEQRTNETLKKEFGFGDKRLNKFWDKFKGGKNED